jgi:mono/diheme cytochrome c family protein
MSGRSVRRWLAATLLGIAGLTAAVMGLNLRGEAALDAQADAATPPDPAQVQRGAYLARAGNCAACHTARGGAPYAGGRPIETPFGTVYSSNLTPDASGLGGWNASAFRRALHNGRSMDGRLLVPAFPYTHFTLVSVADADALWAWLRTLAPVAQNTPAHTLRWPFGTQPALAVWRALFFKPVRFEPDPAASAALNRGAYLVNGLGHCGACHASRNPLGAGGALADAPSGSVLPQQRWYAPSLTAHDDSRLADRPAQELVQLLKTGVSDHAAAMGPMAEVVAGSTQHLAEGDLHAMVAYLQRLAGPAPARAARPSQADRPPATLARGGQLYADHCADCHGRQGQGAPGVYPALAGNPTVTRPDPRNLVLAITQGGFAPATAGNPRPYGMPGFDLPHDDLAALATWLRASWGHDAAPVSAVDALLAR